MKKTIVLMLGLGAGTASFAQQAIPQSPSPSISQTRFVVTPDQKIKLFIQPQLMPGHILLQDARGHSLYTATVARQNGLAQQFDIANLSTGTYQLTITTGTQTVLKTFVVQPLPDQNVVILVA